MRTHTYLSLRQAAEMAGRSKSTISNALKSGKLSYIEKTASGYKIDPAELDRVYPNPSKSVQEGHNRTPSEPLNFLVLKVQLEAKDQLLEELQSEAKDLRQQRDDWKAQATAQTRLLEHQAISKQGWFNLFGGRNRT